MYSIIFVKFRWFLCESYLSYQLTTRILCFFHHFVQVLFFFIACSKFFHLNIMSEIHSSSFAHSPSDLSLSNCLSSLGSLLSVAAQKIQIVAVTTSTFKLSLSIVSRSCLLPIPSFYRLIRSPFVMSELPSYPGLYIFISSVSEISSADVNKTPSLKRIVLHCISLALARFIAYSCNFCVFDSQKVSFFLVFYASPKKERGNLRGTRNKNSSIVHVESHTRVARI